MEATSPNLKTENCSIDVSETAMLNVCRICLCTAGKIYSMNKHKLKDTYEHITGISLQEDNSLPQTLCSECAQRLINCGRLRQKSIRANAVLTELVKMYDKITVPLIKTVDRYANLLHSPLHTLIYEPNYHDFQIEHTDTSKDVDIESIHDIVLKEEDLAITEIWNEGIQNDVRLPSIPRNQKEIHSNTDGVLHNKKTKDLLEGNELNKKLAVLLERVVVNPVNYNDSDIDIDEGDVGAGELDSDIPGLDLKEENLDILIGKDDDFENYDKCYNVECSCDQEIGLPSSALPTSNFSDLGDDNDKRTEEEIRVIKEEPTEETETPTRLMRSRKKTEERRNVDDNLKKTEEKTKNTKEEQIKKIASLLTKSNTVIRRIRKTEDQKKVHDSNKRKEKKAGVTKENQIEEIESLGTKSTTVRRRRHKQTEEIRKRRKVDNNKKTMEKTGETNEEVHDNDKRTEEKTGVTKENQIKEIASLPTKSTTVRRRRHEQTEEIRKRRKVDNNQKTIEKTGETDEEQVERRGKPSRRRCRKEKPKNPSERFACHLCDKSYIVENSLKNHLIIHSGIGIVRCDVCQKPFKRKDTLIVHLRKHTGEHPFCCEICGKTFTQSANLDIHKYRHLSEKTFGCNTCGAKFYNKYSLQTHERLHMAKTYSCEFCPKKFVQLIYLKKHLKYHNGEVKKSITCEVCGKKFSESGNFKQHFRIHTGEKPYECEKCGNRYSQKSSLNQHIRLQHAGDKIDKSYSCEICGKKFSQRNLGFFIQHQKLCLKPESSPVKT